MTKVSVKRHLRELQWRFLLVAVFFIAGATLAYQFQASLIPALLNPLHGQKLVYLNPAGGFSFIFLVSIYAGLALALPVLIQQLYAFLRPALPESARKKSPLIILSSFVLLIAGVAFGYFVAVPNALAFLYGFADTYVEASLTADSYLNFIIAYTIGIGMVFQLPLLLLLINAIKPLTPGGLMKSEKWVVLIAFIIAAIITPTPDPINQAIIAGPVIVVYQIGVIAVLVTLARAKSKQKKLLRLERKAARKASFAEEVLEEMAEETPPVQVPQHTAQPLARAADATVLPTMAAARAAHAQRQASLAAATTTTKSTPQPVAPTQPLIHQLQSHADIQRVEPAASAQMGVIKKQSSLDGIVRRPANLQVPARPVRPQAPVPARPQNGNRPVFTGQQRGGFIDGISAPKRTAIGF